MNTIERAFYLFQEKMQALTKWEQQFIADVCAECAGLTPEQMTEDECEEFVTENQIEKINQIYYDYCKE